MKRIWIGIFITAYLFSACPAVSEQYYIIRDDQYDQEIGVHHINMMLADEAGREIVPPGEYMYMDGLIPFHLTTNKFDYHVVPNYNDNSQAHGPFLVSSKKSEYDYALMSERGELLSDFILNGYLLYDVKTDRIVYLSNDHMCSVIDRQGNELIPIRYRFITPRIEGGYLAFNELYEENNAEILYIDETGEAHPTGNFAMPAFLGFSGGVAVGGMHFNEGAAFGLLSSEGEWVLAPQYDSLEPISGGRYIAANKKFGIIDASGNWIVEPRYINIKTSDLSNQQMLCGYTWDEIDFLDVDTLEVLKRIEWPEHYLADLISGYLCIYDEAQRLLTILDCQGNKAGEICFNDELYDALSTEMSKEEFPGIDIEERVKDPLEPEGWSVGLRNRIEILDLPDGGPLRIILTVSDNKDYILDNEGNVIAGPYEWLDFLGVDEREKGIFSYEHTGETLKKRNFKRNDAFYFYGMIDEDGNEIGQPYYSELYALSNDRFFARANDQWGMIDASGNWLIVHSDYEELMD